MSSTNIFSTSLSSFGRGRLKPAGAKEVVELKDEACWAGHPEELAILPSREEGDVMDAESLDIEGTAVRDELSEENMECAVCDDAADLMLI